MSIEDYRLEWPGGLSNWRTLGMYTDPREVYKKWLPRFGWEHQRTAAMHYRWCKGDMELCMMIRSGELPWMRLTGRRADGTFEVLFSGSLSEGLCRHVTDSAEGTTEDGFCCKCVVKMGPGGPVVEAVMSNPSAVKVWGKRGFNCWHNSLDGSPVLTEMLLCWCLDSEMILDIIKDVFLDTRAAQEPVQASAQG